MIQTANALAAITIAKVMRLTDMRVLCYCNLADVTTDASRRDVTSWRGGHSIPQHDFHDVKGGLSVWIIERIFELVVVDRP
jgi:hypothetical protein